MTLADQNLIDTARNLLMAGDQQAALEILYPLAQSHTGDGSVPFLLGLCLYSLGDYRAALEPLTRSLEFMVNEPGPHLVIANCHQKLGQIAMARSLFERAAIKFPNHAQVWSDIAAHAFEAGAVDDSKNAAGKALVLAPDLMIAYLHLANIAGVKGNIDRQVEHARRAFYLGGGGVAMDLWALGLSDRGDKTGADAIFAQRSASFGHTTLWPLSDGEWAMEHDRFDHAATRFAMALAERPDDGAIWYLLGSALDYCKRYQTAQSAFARAGGLGDRKGAAWSRLYTHKPEYDETVFERVAVEHMGTSRELSDVGVTITHVVNCDVIGNQWYLLSTADRPDTLPRLALPFLQNDSSMLRVSSSRGEALGAAVLDEDRVSEAILIGDSANYYHWLIDELPNAAALSALDPELPILCGWHLVDYHNDAMARLGVETSRLLRVEPMARRRVDKLWVLHARQADLDMAALSGGISPSITTARADWLRSKFFPKASSNVRRRLFISRARAVVRRLENEAEIVDMLSHFGFEMIQLEGMSLQGQIDLFAQAEFVIGPHGAGFANMIFAPVDCILLELMPPGALPTYFSALCAVRGQVYSVLVGEACQSLKPRKRGWWPFRVNANAIAARLVQTGL